MEQNNMVKNRTCKMFLILVFAFFAAVLVPKPVQAAETGQVVVVGERLYSDAWKVLNRVNKERAAEGLPALTMDKGLLEAAMIRAHEIAIYFDHMRPNGEWCHVVFSDYLPLAGENIAIMKKTPKAVMDLWMDSPGHRSNILGEYYTSMGVGAVTVNGTCYWVQCFSASTIQEAVESEYKDGPAAQVVPFDHSLTPISMTVNTTVLKPGSAANVILSFKNDFSTATVTNRTLIFRSSNPSVCTVDTSGNIRGVGVGTATISLISPTNGNVLDSIDMTVTLDLKKTSIKKLTAGKRKLTVRWKKKKKNTDGYEIQYSTNKKFKKAVKTVAIKNNKKNIKTIKKLKRGKKYFVRIRTFKNVTANGQIMRLYSDWSKKKSVKIK